MKNKINRRTLLKSAVVSGSSAIISTQTVHSASKQIEETRLVEIGLRYQLNEEKDYFTVHSEGISGYWVDSINNRINLKPVLPEKSREKFEENNLLVASRDLFRPPAQVTNTRPTPGLATELRYGRVPSKSVVLEEPERPPTISVKKKNNNLKINIEGQTIRSKPGLNREIELDSIHALVQTEIVTGEIVEIEGVSKDEWGPKIEFGAVETKATPIVSITDYGALPVVDSS